MSWGSEINNVTFWFELVSCFENGDGGVVSSGSGESKGKLI